MKHKHKKGRKEAIQKVEMKKIPAGQLREKAFIPLERALKHSNCCVCRLVRESDEQRIWFLIYEHTGDPIIRHQFDKALGFCHYHGHLALGVVREREMMTESSIARLYETVVMTYRERLGEVSTSKRRFRASRLGGQAPGEIPATECMICESNSQAVTGNIGALLRMLSEEKHRSTYIKSEGLCNPHFALAFHKAEANTRRFLLEDHERRMEEVQRRLSELQRKQSYDVQEKPTIEEEHSWIEAVWRFTGVSWEGLLLKREGSKTLGSVRDRGLR